MAESPTAQRTLEQRYTLLRTALRANAAFSGVSGLTLIVAAGWLIDLLGVTPAGALVFVGANLLVLCGALLWVAARRPMPRGLAWTAVVLDALWVVGSLVLLLTDLLPLTTSGRWIIALLALIVAGFGGAQWAGLRHR